MENEVGVLARISSLFSGKSYNLNSLTVGPTLDQTVSRMTIGLTSDAQTFEQVKKQLNRSIEVIKVVDFTDTSIHIKEVMFVKISHCTGQDMEEIFRYGQVFGIKAVDCGPTSVLLESVQTEAGNDQILKMLEGRFLNRVEIVRGGSVAVEAIS